MMWPEVAEMEILEHNNQQTLKWSTHAHEVQNTMPWHMQDQNGKVVTNLASRVSRTGHRAQSNDNLSYYRDKMEYPIPQRVRARVHMYICKYMLYKPITASHQPLRKYWD